MRTIWGWVLSVLGLLLALLGVAVMVVLGPDSRFSTGPHAIETDDTAVVTAPRVISWADVQIDVLAEVPVRKPIFIGLANSVDVRDYVSRTERLEITRFQRPWTIATREVDGRPNLPGAPTALDWWIVSSAGLGGASISTELPDQTVSLAVLSVGSSNLSGLQVTVAYGVKGGFARGAGLLLLGIAVVWIGFLVRRTREWDEDEDDVDDELEVVEEVVYVYVDDDGVEHEISAEEAETFEVVEETTDEDPPGGKESEEPEPEEPEPDEPEPDEPEESDQREEDALVAPAMPPPQVPGVLTAADIAAGAEDAAEDTDDEPADDEPERVVYVFVDEDGVEHELSEDELADFEVVDDEEDER